jgi:hypothetical protein
MERCYHWMERCYHWMERCCHWMERLLPLDGALLPLDGALLPLDGALPPLDGALLPLDVGISGAWRSTSGWFYEAPTGGNPVSILHLKKSFAVLASFSWPPQDIVAFCASAPSGVDILWVLIRCPLTGYAQLIDSPPARYPQAFSTSKFPASS